MSKGIPRYGQKLLVADWKVWVQGINFESDELIGYRRRSSKMKNLARYCINLV